MSPWNRWFVNEICFLSRSALKREIGWWNLLKKERLQKFNLKPFTAHTDSPDISLRTRWPVSGHLPHALSHPLTSAWTLGGLSTSTPHLIAIIQLNDIKKKKQCEFMSEYLLYPPADRHQTPVCRLKTGTKTSSWDTGGGGRCIDEEIKKIINSRIKGSARQHHSPCHCTSAGTVQPGHKEVYGGFLQLLSASAGGEE